MQIFNEILYLILIVFCAIAAFKDAKTRRIPNWIPITLFCIWLVSVFAKWMLSGMGILDVEAIDVFVECAKQVLTSAVICCILAACVVLANKWKKRKGKAKSSPFGMGDVKLLMVVCLFLGFDASLICIICACISFLVYISAISIGKRAKISSAPFAPFIFAGVIASVIISLL